MDKKGPENYVNFFRLKDDHLPDVLRWIAVWSRCCWKNSWEPEKVPMTGWRWSHHSSPSSFTSSTSTSTFSCTVVGLFRCHWVKAWSTEDDNFFFFLTFSSPYYIHFHGSSFVFDDGLLCIFIAESELFVMSPEVCDCIHQFFFSALFLMH